MALMPSEFDSVDSVYTQMAYDSTVSGYPISISGIYFIFIRGGATTVHTVYLRHNSTDITLGSVTCANSGIYMPFYPIYAQAGDIIKQVGNDSFGTFVFRLMPTV